MVDGTLPEQDSETPLRIWEHVCDLGAWPWTPSQMETESWVQNCGALCRFKGEEKVQGYFETSFYWETWFRFKRIPRICFYTLSLVHFFFGPTTSHADIQYAQQFPSHPKPVSCRGTIQCHSLERWLTRSRKWRWAVGDVLSCQPLSQQPFTPWLVWSGPKVLMCGNLLAYMICTSIWGERHPSKYLRNGSLTFPKNLDELSRRLLELFHRTQQIVTENDHFSTGLNSFLQLFKKKS